MDQRRDRPRDEPRQGHGAAGDRPGPDTDGPVAAGPDAHLRAGRQAPRGPAAPQLPKILLDPRPAVAVGFLAWAIVTIVIAATVGSGASALPTCYAGLGIGAVGTVIFLIQRRGARSGRKGAQRGLH